MDKKKSIGVKRKKRIFLLFSICYFFFFILFISTFRFIRGFFPIPKIGKDGIAGYSHFFGYPFYYDSLIIAIIILFPVVFFFIAKTVKLNGKK